MKVSIGMLLVGIPGRKLNGQFQEVASNISHGIILFPMPAGIRWLA
jgi:hypothetical protein